MDADWIQVGIAIGTLIFTIGGAWTAFLFTTKHLKYRIAKLENVLNASRNANDTLRERNNTEKQAIDEQIRKIELRTASIEAAINHKSKELETLRSCINTCTSDTTSAHKRLDSALSIIHAAEVELANAKQALANTKQELSVLKDGVADRLHYFEKAEKAVNELLINHGQLSVKVERNETDIRGLAQSSSALETRVAKIEANKHGDR